MKYLEALALSLIFVFYTSCKGQNKVDRLKNNVKSESKEVITSHGPNSITRTIKQDRNGNIWIASFEGVFKYDGKSFSNITSKVSLSRFFSVLEDRKGNLWFASVGSGVYYYDGKSFQNFTTKEGLVNNSVSSIYEDKTGKIWFGTGGGVSCYDGKSFRNFTTKEGLSHNDVNSIIEDKTGKFWFGTRGDACLYNGKTFTSLKNQVGKNFKNVRSIVEDREGNIWLGGADGLWTYDGRTLTNFSHNFVGYVYEDKKGNIWTSSESAYTQAWVLSRYNENRLSHKKAVATEIKSHKGVIFGILEDSHGSIWFGTPTGVYRYDGITFNDFKS